MPPAQPHTTTVLSPVSPRHTPYHARLAAPPPDLCANRRAPAPPSNRARSIATCPSSAWAVGAAATSPPAPARHRAAHACVPPPGLARRVVVRTTIHTGAAFRLWCPCAAPTRAPYDHIPNRSSTRQPARRYDRTKTSGARAPAPPQQKPQCMLLLVRSRTLLWPFLVKHTRDFVSSFKRIRPPSLSMQLSTGGASVHAHAPPSSQAARSRDEPPAAATGVKLLCTGLNIDRAVLALRPCTETTLVRLTCARERLPRRLHYLRYRRNRTLSLTIDFNMTFNINS